MAVIEVPADTHCTITSIAIAAIIAIIPILIYFFLLLFGLFLVSLEIKDFEELINPNGLINTNIHPKEIG